MAQLLAPYNNSMRLGQGFNSYTHQICLEDAVFPVVSPYDTLSDTGSNHGHHTPPTSKGSPGTGDKSDDNETSTQKPAWVKPQIVTYSSSFVDNLKDVTKSMNISGSLSIKTAQIGGTASGSYVDSDKFKNADINFHLNVKVVNQVVEASEYSNFNRLEKMTKQNFTELYGDTFISGWETGGELHAVISVEVKDKSKIFEIKAHIEGHLTAGAISGGIKADFGKKDNDISKHTETTITVNWAGGGSIKDPSADWTMESLKKAAAAFPELVAMTPQRTYAILTKYTNLPSFHNQVKDISPLDYENAGIYTGALLDYYMDYKAMWKQISLATSELESNRATIEMSTPGEDVYELAQVTALPEKQIDRKLKDIKERMTEKDKKDTVVSRSTDYTTASASDPRLISTLSVMEYQTTSAARFAVFQPTFAGLIAARRICRVEMSKIVNEVDLVTVDPLLATDTQRDQFFLHPLIFKMLLPIVRSLSPEDQKLGVKNPNAAVLLGYVPPKVNRNALPRLYVLESSIRHYADSLATSIQKLEYKSEDYRLQGTAGETKAVHSTATLFNDLENLDATYRIQKLLIWRTAGIIAGLRIHYSNALLKQHGSCEGDHSHELLLDPEGTETISEVLIEEGIREDTPKNERSVIRRLALATTLCQLIDTDTVQERAVEEKSDEEVLLERLQRTVEEAYNLKPNPPPGPPPPDEVFKEKMTHTYSLSEEGQWSLRGFFGFTYKTGFSTLGVVWGKDSFVPVQKKPLRYALCRNFIELSPELQADIRQFVVRPATKRFCEHFVLGKTIDAGPPKGERKVFSALTSIDINYKIRSIDFYSVDNKLRGLGVTYTNDFKVQYGTCGQVTWTARLEADLVVVKLTAGSLVKDEERYIDTIEFVRTGQEGHMPNWPLETRTLRYLGEREERVKEKKTEVVERAPTFANMRWSVRGFYGEQTGSVITKLGIVWGCG